MSIFPCKKLGFGMMRLPLDENNAVDIKATTDMVDVFMEKGFNYFDTAYVYHDEKSEGILRKCLVERYERDKFFIADKLPLWNVQNKQDPQKLFDIQKERCGVEYFDYYLLHSIQSDKMRALDDCDVWDWAKKQKELGTVKRIGFSFHDTAEMLEELLIKHDFVEFVQLQINYMDWESDSIQSRKCYEVARKYNKEIIVMEPVKGGLLVDFKPEFENILKQFSPSSTLASWAFRYVGSLDGVSVILSGMSNMEQLVENTKIFDNFTQMTNEERKILNEVVEGILNTKTIGCTACAYCVPGCPVNIKIPDMLRSYNNYIKYGINSPGVKSMHDFLTSGNNKAGNCIECGQCEDICPQHLNIISALNETAQVLEQ